MAIFTLEVLDQTVDLGWNLDQMISEIQDSDWTYLPDLGSHAYRCNFYNIFTDKAYEFINYLNSLKQTILQKPVLTDAETIFVTANLDPYNISILKTATDMAGTAFYDTVNPYVCVYTLKNGNKWKAQWALDYPIDPSIPIKYYIPDDEFYSYNVIEQTWDNNFVYIINKGLTTKGLPTVNDTNTTDFYYRLNLVLNF